MKLKTVNRWLKKIDLVLVVQSGEDALTELWVERRSRYHKRVIRSSNPEVDGCLMWRPTLEDECRCGALPDVHEQKIEGCEMNRL